MERKYKKELNRQFFGSVFDYFYDYSVISKTSQTNIKPEEKIVQSIKICPEYLKYKRELNGQFMGSIYNDM